VAGQGCGTVVAPAQQLPVSVVVPTFTHQDTLALSQKHTDTVKNGHKFIKNAHNDISPQWLGSMIRAPPLVLVCLTLPQGSVGGFYPNKLRIHICGCTHVAYSARGGSGYVTFMCITASVASLLSAEYRASERYLRRCWTRFRLRPLPMCSHAGPGCLDLGLTWGWRERCARQIDRRVAQKRPWCWFSLILQ
jgi:hypothetical protein